MGEDIITMSTINYVSTNYAKDFSSYVTIDGKPKYIHQSYRKKLNRWTKKKFDAFCRQTKFPFYYNDNEYVVTTVGQLNYYKWCLEIDLLTFIRENYDDIIINMKRKAEKSKLASASASASQSISASMSDMSLIDSEMTASEQTRYKNKIIVSKSIKPDFKIS